MRIKSLLTNDDIVLLRKKSESRINISDDTIITPLAKDTLKKERISVTSLGEITNLSTNEIWNISESNVIALLSNNETYKYKTVEILRSRGKNVECISPKNFTTEELKRSFVNIVDKVRSGNFKSAIVISTDAYMLKQSFINTQNLITNICWEINEKNSCSTRSKFLLINSDLIGFKMLDEKIRTWLEFNHF